MFLTSEKAGCRRGRWWGTVRKEKVALKFLRQENSLIFSCQTTGVLIIPAF